MSKYSVLLLFCATFIFIDVDASPSKSENVELLEENLETKNPIQLFSNWFKNASENKAVKYPSAACLATASKSGIPSARYVMIKNFDEAGFIFYANSDSRKGQEIEENPIAAISIYWEALDRAVRIEGSVEKMSETEATENFNKLPKNKQIGAHVSQQNKVLSNKKELSDLIKSVEAEYTEKKVSKPANWNGYRLVPKKIEFWQGQKDKLHDRIVFERADQLAAETKTVSHAGENGWAFYRLSP